MKMKNLLMTVFAVLGVTAATIAQVPNYVPTDGLVGWWPFNGNANDESGNGNDGMVNGAILTTDRFSNINNAYSFDGVNDLITIVTSTHPTGNVDITYSLWIYSLNNSVNKSLLNVGDNGITNKRSAIGNEITGGISYIAQANDIASSYFSPLNQWHNIIVTKAGESVNFFLDGMLFNFGTITSGQNITNTRIVFGSNGTNWGGGEFFSGKLDDIGIWNRALTQQEISNLYNAVSCANNTAITPQINSVATGSTVTFSASTSDPNPTYVWQSDLGQGFQTLNDFGNYSGVNTATLNISNVQLSEHNQPIRVISTSGDCSDTSNVALISISDTCINTINDTTFITVTDTLIINTNIAGMIAPDNTNTIKVFPNPANDHITIDYGNFSIMNGYQLVIENSLGQQVFQTNITQQTDYLSLSTWGGNGLYFVHIVDPQGNTIDIRKIVLQ
jgi:hypothetical protein